MLKDSKNKMYPVVSGAIQAILSNTDAKGKQLYFSCSVPQGEWNTMSEIRPVISTKFSEQSLE